MKHKTTCYTGGSYKGYTKWMCKYHIIFTPKFRRKIIYAKYRKSIKDRLKDLCRYKGVEIIEGNLMPDHVHMLVSIPPKISISEFMGYLKRKSALMIFERHVNLKYKFGNRRFLSEGYYVSTNGLNEVKDTSAFRRWLVIEAYSLSASYQFYG